MTVDEWNAVHKCCENIIHKWYNTHGVFDKPRDVEDKIEDATWYVFYLLDRHKETLKDVRCKLVTFCYLPCINILLNKQTQFREKTERVMELFDDTATYDSFEEDVLDEINTN